MEQEGCITIAEHHIYRMKGAEPAPVGGDTESWFRFYKWEAEGETFVPRQPGEHFDAEAGDYLWFVMDDELVGGVPIRRVFVDPWADVQELWYDTAAAWVPLPGVFIPSGAYLVPEALVGLLTSGCALRSHVSAPLLPSPTFIEIP